MARKKTKLTEKATRIPDTRQVQWDEVIPQYLHEVEQLHKEQARSHRFVQTVPNFPLCEMRRRIKIGG